MKYCPFKMANPGLTEHFDPQEGRFIETSWQCEEAACQLWNERFGQCSLAVEDIKVDAYLKGQEDWQNEKKLLRSMALGKGE